MYFRVNMRVLNGGGEREIWFIAETDHASMDDVFAEMDEREMLLVTRHEVRALQTRRGRQITSSSRMIVMKQTVLSIQELAEDLLDTDGTVLWSTEGDGAVS